MPSDRWSRVEAVFEQAAELAGDERSAFLEDACGDDREGRRDVESLLAADGDAGSFLEEPVLEDLAEHLRDAGAAALAIHAELLGEDHPETLKARELLAGLYENWGQPAPPEAGGRVDGAER